MSYDLETEKRFVEAIRQVKPVIILTHAPNDYHPDHINTSKLVFSASLKATIMYYKTESSATEKRSGIYYFDTLGRIDFMPELYVDITDTFDRKVEALKCHESQIKFLADLWGIDSVEFMKTVARFRGQQAGVKYAEAFRQCRVHPSVRLLHLLP